MQPIPKLRSRSTPEQQAEVDRALSRVSADYFDAAERLIGEGERPTPEAVARALGWEASEVAGLVFRFRLREMIPEGLVEPGDVEGDTGVDDLWERARVERMARDGDADQLQPEDRTPPPPRVKDRHRHPVRHFSGGRKVVWG